MTTPADVAILNTVVLLVLGAAVALIGHWGRRHAERLASAGLTPSAHAHKAGVLRRGGLGCYLTGGALVTLAVMSLF